MWTKKYLSWQNLQQNFPEKNKWLQSEHSYLTNPAKVEKLTEKIGALKRIRLLISAPTLHLTYQALVKPHFDYCDIVWGNCGKTLGDKLEKLQNRAARVMQPSYSSF